MINLRAHRRVRFVAASLLGLMVAGAALVATPATASAATSSQWAPAVVGCDNLGNFLDLTPFAAPAPGYSSQTVHYRYMIYNATSGKYVQWMNTGSVSAWGSFVASSSGTTATESGVFSWTISGRTPGPMTRVVLPNGTYQVWTQYAWLVDGRWDYAQGWSNRYQSYPWSDAIPAISCQI